MLYALINGGAPYLLRDGAYPNTDGAFAQDEAHMPELIARCQVVSDLHSRIAKCELYPTALIRTTGNSGIRICRRHEGYSRPGKTDLHHFCLINK